MSNQLKGLKVNFISLVKKGANREPLQVLKFDEEDYGSLDDLLKSEVEVEPVTKDEKSLIQRMKDLLLGESKPVVKAGIRDFTSRITDLSSNIWRAASVLDDVLWEITRSDSEDKLAQISTAIDQYKTYIIEVCNRVGITKAADGGPHSEIVKQQVRDHLDGLVNLVKSVKEEGNEEVTKEEIQAQINETMAPISKGLEDLTKSIEEIRKSSEKPAEKPATETTTEDPVLKQSDLKSFLEVVKGIPDGLSALKDSVQGIASRVSKLENTQEEPAGSEEADGQAADLEKDDPWHGIFRGALDKR